MKKKINIAIVGLGQIGSYLLNELNNKLDGKVSTKVSKEKNYCKAEGYHQKYEQKKSLKYWKTKK